MQLFLTNKDRLILGSNGTYPTSVIEVDKEGNQKKHDISEKFTRPWIKHHFLTHILRESGTEEAIESRDKNLIDILKTTLPLAENSYSESALPSWKPFIDISFKTVEARWYAGQKKIFNKDKFDSAIEQMELDLPLSNSQRSFLFLDENRFLRKLSKIPIKLFFSVSPKDKQHILEVVRQVLGQNPHNRDIELLAYLFYRASNMLEDLVEFSRELERPEFEEWIYWAENDMKSLGEIKKLKNDFISSFYFFDSSNLSPDTCKEIAEWYLGESEFKQAYHFYYKAKEFEIAQDILQNIGAKEYGALLAMRQLNATTNIDLSEANLKNLFEQELQTLSGFNRIRANEAYKKVASLPAAHLDRETVENKYAFGELTEEEYVRLITQLRDRRH
jgi:hypothetical protein